MEIEYNTENVYQYLRINKDTWGKFLEFADKGKGSGNYVNKNFKEKVEKNHCDSMNR